MKYFLCKLLVLKCHGLKASLIKGWVAQEPGKSLPSEENILGMSVVLLESEGASYWYRERNSFSWQSCLRGCRSATDRSLNNMSSLPSVKEDASGLNFLGCLCPEEWFFQSPFLEWMRFFRLCLKEIPTLKSHFLFSSLPEICLVCWTSSLVITLVSRLLWRTQDLLQQCCLSATLCSCQIFPTSCSSVAMGH